MISINRFSIGLEMLETQNSNQSNFNIFSNCLPNNCSLDNNCSSYQNFTTASEILECYRYLYKIRWEVNTAEILLAVSIVVLNTVVIAILAKKQAKLSIFDKMMITHCIVDGLTGLLDVPFFHFTHVLGFWPFGKIIGLIWTSFDNGINVITNLHMLYITWIRFRSIKAPNTYEKEFLARHPLFVSVFIWLFGLLIWTSVVFSYGIIDFTTNIKFKEIWSEVVLIFLTWFCPLIGIMVLAGIILVILNRRNKRVAHMRKRVRPSMMTHTTVGVSNHSGTPVSTETNSFRKQLVRKFRMHMRLGPQIRFEIIIFSFWLQWFPSCIISIVDPLCSCVPFSISSTIYWLTYTVCLTDPLVILIFNPNVAINSRKSNVIN